MDELIEAFDENMELDPNRCKFKITYDHSELEDIMSYNEILDYVERNVNNEDDDRWNFRKVLKHQVIPSKKGNKSVLNIQMLWETGAVSTESLEQLAKEIPVELALYAKKNGLLEQDGWKRFKRIANKEKHVTRRIKQVKL